jgi:hypothetical protein
MKQTAVQFIMDNLQANLVLNKNYTQMWEQALQMEKAQVIHAHLTGLMHPLEMEATKQAEQYYNQTYGGKP